MTNIGTDTASYSSETFAHAGLLILSGVSFDFHSLQRQFKLMSWQIFDNQRTALLSPCCLLHLKRSGFLKRQKKMIPVKDKITSSFQNELLFFSTVLYQLKCVCVKNQTNKAVSNGSGDKKDVLWAVCFCNLSSFTKLFGAQRLVCSLNNNV